MTKFKLRPASEAATKAAVDAAEAAANAAARSLISASSRELSEEDAATASWHVIALLAAKEIHSHGDTTENFVLTVEGYLAVLRPRAARRGGETAEDGA